MQFLKEQKGSALIYILICSLLLTSNTVGNFKLSSIAATSDPAKGSSFTSQNILLKAALYQSLEQIEQNWEVIPQEKK